jgi:O-methyltransferase involved in polyketide biosynthesis
LPLQRRGIHYIDTDLPDVVATKKGILAALQKDVSLGGTLELLPLNALDKTAFREVVSRFPVGEIAIVNEGLLIYLDTYEKENLCSIIHRILMERGGCWVTADIYLKNRVQKLDLEIDEETLEFFAKHNIEDNKFESFEEARDFFERMGFVIEEEAHVDRSKLSVMTASRGAPEEEPRYF